MVTPWDLGSRSSPSLLLLCPFPRIPPRPRAQSHVSSVVSSHPVFPSSPSHRIPVPTSLPSLEQWAAPPHPQIPPSHPSKLAWGTQRVTAGHILRFIGKHILEGAQGVMGIHLSVTRGEHKVFLGYISLSLQADTDFWGYTSLSLLAQRVPQPLQHCSQHCCHCHSPRIGLLQPG